MISDRDPPLSPLGTHQHGHQTEQWIGTHCSLGGWVVGGIDLQARPSTLVAGGHGPERERGPLGGLSTCEIPAASYSPRESPPKYHRRWRA